MSDVEPVLIRAIDRRAADDVARDLGLHPSEWRYLDSARVLYGRPVLRIAVGHLYWKHPNGKEIDNVLAALGKNPTRTIERVEVPR